MHSRVREDPVNHGDLHVLEGPFRGQCIVAAHIVGVGLVLLLHVQLVVELVVILAKERV